MTLPKFDKDNLKDLYSILSSGLLDEEDLKKMGKYYRNEDVYIHYSSNTATPPDMGITPLSIQKHMDYLFAFANNFCEDTGVDTFINSQLMHFYFAIIHPYYDINGRTERTFSIWYLLEKGAGPYTIFNRGISLLNRRYIELIRRARRSHNLTPFIMSMLEGVKEELEKELIIGMIKNSSGGLSGLEEQSLHYILSMRGSKNISQFATFYNFNNGKKKFKIIYDEMITPLLERGILVRGRNTKKWISSDLTNFEFSLNEKLFESDPKNIKRLII